MFCREVGTTIIRGISDKNKAEIPSKKRFFGGGCHRQGPGRRGCERPPGVWRPAEVERGAVGSAGRKQRRCVWRE